MVMICLIIYRHKTKY